MTPHQEVTGYCHIDKILDSHEFYHFKVFLLAICFIIQIFGNPMCLAIWSYERYGGDPQKRTILNQLTSDLAWHCILANMTSLATFMFRLTTGPLSTFMASSTYYVSNQTVAISAMLSLNEMAILKFLSIFTWKRLPPINEDFFGHFLRIMNHLVGFLFALFGRMGGSNDNEMYFILTGLPLLSNSNDPIFR